MTSLGLLGSLAACTGVDPSPSSHLPPLPDRADVPALDSVSAGESRPQRELTIALTGDVRGEIEPCGCPTLPYGGFERREHLLARMPHTGPIFQLDAGELLTKGVSTWRLDRDGRARVVLQASASVGVDVWVPGPSDLLSLSVKELQASTAPLALSATWTDQDGVLLFPPATVLERDGRRLGVIGLSAAVEAPDLAGLVQTRDPVEATRDALASLPEDVDLVVVLGSVNDDQADRVATEVPGIAALLTTSGRNYDDVRVVKGVPIFESTDRGRFIQALSTHLGSTSGQPLELRPDAKDWRALVTLRAQGASTSSAKQADAQLSALSAGRNLAWLESRPLAEDLDGPARVTHILGRFKQQVLDDASQRAAAARPPSTPGYATASACTTCHLDEFARWTFTDHAKAWQSLIVRKATGNAECLPCHTTGFGQPGGLGELTTLALRAFKDVQCEACHGPMKHHPDDKTVKSQ
ncbi:MAG: hypothetical protein GXP62_10735, partial [Oligoflexia bacterium]|nr:hypothetical protein [Oligoflexia bacterium]